MAVSLPIPELPPVMITVLPVSLFRLLHTPIVSTRRAFKPASTNRTSNAIFTQKGNANRNVNIFSLAN
jgi:hypothetical protein